MAPTYYLHTCTPLHRRAISKENIHQWVKWIKFMLPTPTTPNLGRRSWTVSMAPSLLSASQRYHASRQRSFLGRMRGTHGLSSAFLGPIFAISMPGAG